MTLVLDMSARPLLLAWWWEPGGEGPPLEIRDPVTARALLARAAGSSPGDPGKLRSLLRKWQTAPAFGLDDAQVREQLAAAIVARKLHVWELPRVPLTTFGDLEEAMPEAVYIEPSAPVIEPEPEEEPKFPSGIDPEEIARILRQASATGVPFCEECLKKKLLDAAKDPDASAEDLDAVAAAAVLQEAAKTGTPFCEECMKKSLRDGRATKAPGGGGGARAAAREARS